MGLFDFITGKKEKGKEKTIEETKEIKQEGKNEENKSLQNSVMGIVDRFLLLDSDDLVVIGNLSGTIKVGDAVYISNPGDDEGGMFLTQVLGIEKGPKESVDTITNARAAIRIEKGAGVRIKKGSVMFSREASSAEVHKAYINALGDAYIGHQKLELSDKDLDELSITDCAELWRLFIFYQKNFQKDHENQIKENTEKRNRLCDALCKKILSCNEIFCVYSKITNEPYLFSQTVDQKDGTYMCTPPDVMLVTKAYENVMKNYFSAEKFELRKIENNEKKDGIYNFLGSTFYLNGACGVSILSQETSIGAQMLVPPPDVSNIPKQNIPITNPELVRWLLLIGQMEKPSSKEAELIYKLYYRFMSLEMAKAKFLIPMKGTAPLPEGDENGKAVFEKDTSIQFPTMDGKYGRPAVRMYTDWKRLRMVYGEEWSAMVQPVDGFISVMDCAINATDFPAAGCYVGKDMYEEMKSFGQKKEADIS